LHRVGALANSQGIAKKLSWLNPLPLGARMLKPSSAIYDYIVRELAPSDHEPDEAPINIVCEPLGVTAGVSTRGIITMRLKAGTTPSRSPGHRQHAAGQGQGTVSPGSVGRRSRMNLTYALPNRGLFRLRHQQAGWRQPIRPYPDDTRPVAKQPGEQVLDLSERADDAGRTRPPGCLATAAGADRR